MNSVFEAKGAVIGPGFRCALDGEAQTRLEKALSKAGKLASTIESNTDAARNRFLQSCLEEANVFEKHVTKACKELTEKLNCTELDIIECKVKMSQIQAITGILQDGIVYPLLFGLDKGLSKEEQIESVKNSVKRTCENQYGAEHPSDDNRTLACTGRVNSVDCR